MLHNRRAWLAGLVILVITLALLWPAMLNGGPFYHPDTPSYFRAAASAVFKLTGLRSDWTGEFFRVYETGSGAAPTRIVTAAHREIPVTLSGRSVYFGTFLYVAYLFGSVWIVAIAQSLLTAVSIYLTSQSIGRAAGRDISPVAPLLIGLITAVGTSAGFFSGHLMPGIFTGLGMLALANLLFLWDRLSRAESIFWCAMLAFAVLAHSTNLLLFSILAGIFLGSAFARRLKVPVPQFLCVVGCIAIGVAGQAVFSRAVTATTGAAPVRPPFIAMRLIEDGSGYAYLQEHCGREHYIYCRVLGQANPQSDTLLWSDDPRLTLFRGLSPDEQRMSARQQRRFVLSVISSRPLEVIAEIARNTGEQLLDLDLEGFNYTGGNRARYEQTLPPPLMQAMKNTRAYRERMPVDAIEATTALLSILSVLLLIRFIVRPRASEPQQLRAYALCVLFALVINAGICGALSGPKGRYEMRLIWVLPVVASSIAFAGRKRIPLDRSASTLFLGS